MLSENMKIEFLFGRMKGLEKKGFDIRVKDSNSLTISFPDGRVEYIYGDHNQAIAFIDGYLYAQEYAKRMKRSGK